jgi:hypothetical protein
MGITLVLKAGDSLRMVPAMLTQSTIHVTLWRGSIKTLLLPPEYLYQTSTHPGIMSPLCPLRLFMTGMFIPTGPHMRGPDTMITGTEVQSVMRNLPMAEKGHHMDWRDLHMGEKDHHMDVRGHHIGETDPHMDMIDPPMDVRNPHTDERDPHMDLRNHLMTEAAITSIEKGVLLMWKGPHRIVPGTMTAAIGHQITWSDPHMIGLSPIIIEKQERGEPLRSGTLSMVINSRRIRSAKRILMQGTQNPQLRNLKIKVVCLILMVWMKRMPAVKLA